MQWKGLVVVTLVLLLQGLAEVRSRRNNTRNHKRTQHNDRLRLSESRFSDFPHPQESTGEGGPVAPPQQSLNNRRPQQHNRKRHNHNNNNNNNKNHHRSNLHPNQRLLQNECPNCYQLEMRKNLRLAQIKDRVMTATGLISPPNMTGVVISSNPDVQEIIQDMESASPVTYMQEPVYNEDEPDIKTEKLFVPVQPGNSIISSPGNLALVQQYLCLP